MIKKTYLKSMITIVLVIAGIGYFPSHSFASTSVTSLVKKAESAGKSLNTSIIYNGSGSPVKPVAPLKKANQALSAAKAAVKKLPVKKRTAYNKRLATVSVSISRAKTYQSAITKGNAIISKKKILDAQTSASLTNTEKAYNTLSAELKDVSIFKKVYGTATKANLVKYYVDPAKAALLKVKPALDMKSSISELNKLISSRAASSALADPYKKIMITLPSISQPVLKRDLYNLLGQTEKLMTVSEKTGNLAEFLALEDYFSRLDVLVKPQKSDPSVPGIYHNIMDASTQNLYTLKEQGLLKSRLDSIMARLTIDQKQLKELLTQKAIDKGIPPEIVKGIVLTENAKQQQFTAEGDVFKSLDNGFGIMQVTPASTDDIPINWDLAKYDLRANIDAGISVLLNKWNLAGSGKIPRINHQNKLVLEDWYFALWAYNGLSNYNDPNNPNVKSSVYQWKVYDNISRYVQVNPSVIQNRDLMVVNQEGWPSFAGKMIYTTPTQTRSAQMYTKGNSVVLKNSSRLRTSPSTSSAYTTLTANTKVEIIQRAEDSSAANYFNWYLVKAAAGKQGWIASVNLY